VSRHSAYNRRLQDLPWQGMSVQLWIAARRFRCRNRNCPQKIFCERLPQVASTYARQTERLSDIVGLVGYVAGGRAGERLLVRLGIQASDDTVLRRLKQNQPQTPEALHNIGVDDWAWRKGQEYGTIVVSLDLHRVVDLLPDRSSESLSDWLAKHPELLTIARDRCGLYTEGASIGAPQAQQVADRFHLLVNLSSRVERVLEQYSRYLVLPAKESDQPSIADATDNCSIEPTPATALTRAEQRRQRRCERYQAVLDLFKKGYSQKAISRELGLQRKTIRRWLRAGQFPERKPPVRRPPKVHEFADYLISVGMKVVITRPSCTKRSVTRATGANVPCSPNSSRPGA